MREPPVLSMGTFVLDQLRRRAVHSRKRVRVVRVAAPDAESNMPVETLTEEELKRKRAAFLQMLRDNAKVYVDSFKLHEVGDYVLVTHDDTKRTLIIQKGEDVDDAKTSEEHQSKLAYAVHFIVSRYTDLPDDANDGTCNELVKKYSGLLRYASKSHPDAWKEEKEYTREKLKHDDELLIFPPLPKFEEAFSKISLPAKAESTKILPAMAGSMYTDDSFIDSQMYRYRKNDPQHDPYKYVPERTRKRSRPSKLLGQLL